MMLILTALVMSAAGPVTPDVSQLGISVGEEGLAEFRGKVTGRPDAKCAEDRDNVLLCVIGDGGEIYQFTKSGHPGHPAAYFLGYAEREGSLLLEERGWGTANGAPQEAFWKASRLAEKQPVKPAG